MGEPPGDRIEGGCVTADRDPDRFYRLARWYASGTAETDPEGSAWLSTNDRLLRWMSEKGHGTWREFRVAHAWVSDQPGDTAEPAWAAARDLQDLGYAEFAWGKDLDWCVAPPVLSLLPASGGLGYLTGARTASLVAALAADEECFPDAVRQGGSGPHGVFVSIASWAEASALANRLDVSLEFAFPERISDALPDLQTMLAAGRPSPFPLGFERQRFEPAALEWRDVSEDDAPAAGLYRIQTWGRTEFRLVRDADHILACSPEVGVYEVLRWERVTLLEYSPEHATLRVPVVARLPVLHARAAALSSGLLPRLVYATNAYWLIYDNVSAEVADAIAGSLSQEGVLDA